MLQARTSVEDDLGSDPTLFEREATITIARLVGIFFRRTESNCRLECPLAYKFVNFQLENFYVVEITL